MINMTEFAARRKKLLHQIGANSIVILPSAPAIIRNGDAHHPFRQQSDFYYLTGFEEPDAVAILIPHRQDGEFILFNRARDPLKEQWDGYFAGQEGAIEHFGADQSFPITELEMRLPELLEGHTQIHYALGFNHTFDRLLFRALNKVRKKIRGGQQSPPIFIDIIETIHEMRLTKSLAEVTIMRKAAEISAHAHLRAMQLCRPGMNEYELEAEILYEFHRQGARFPAYTSIVGSGENACILHYIQNNRVIQQNDLVLIDAGCELHNYAADITRTFPANGRFTAEQKAIYEIVLAAQMAAIDSVQPGTPWHTAQDIILSILTQGLVDVGILTGNVTGLIEQEATLPYYMHRSGHWLGLDVHDVGRYKINQHWRPLHAGMVLTIEPGLYLSSTIPGLDPRWHGIGVRIEDDVLVTEHGHDILSAAAPKRIEEIEEAMEAARHVG